MGFAKTVFDHEIKIRQSQAAQGLESAEQAENFAKQANNQDFEHGCNGFPWQRLVSLSD